MLGTGAERIDRNAVGSDDTTKVEPDRDLAAVDAIDEAEQDVAEQDVAEQDVAEQDVAEQDVAEQDPHPAPVARPQEKPSWQARTIGYQPALDGLRAVAVALVIAYHLGYSHVAGGYIGVEVFFVLSGWLVCALLVNEHQRTGRIALKDFWLRRARRLLPGLVVVGTATLALASVVQPERLAELRSQAVAALGYHLNWRLLLDQQSYFEAAEGPAGLEHLWSLSIEEQFYLAFPLLCGLVLTRWSRKRAVAIALGGALVATVLRLVLYAPGADPTRAYFGTDTRAAGLLLGVALGVFWTPNRLRPQSSPRFAAVLDAAAVAGAAVLVWYTVVLSDRDPTAFRSGFTAVQLGTLALIAVAVFPAPTRTRRALSSRPLCWVGQRSYGIYLIHWPVIVFASSAPGQQPEAPGTVAAQLAAVVGLAALMYRWIEQPIRHRGLRDAARGAHAGVLALVRGRPVAATAVAVASAVLLGVSLDVSHEVATASPPRRGQRESVTMTARATSTSPTTAAALVAPAGQAVVPPAPTAVPAAPSFPPTTAIGDSVLVGAADALAARMGPALTIDALIGRQMVDADELARDLAGRGQLGQVVLLHLGNNGPFTAEQIDAVFAAVGPDRTVLLVNVLVPRRWEGEVNDQLAAAIDRHPNAVLVDWRSIVTSEPGLTRSDGYHLTGDGAERFADLVVGQVPSV
jgi:peptidoglycan/LPS O-acetylase OafA/YrhL